jgi:hypothetical protein
VTFFADDGKFEGVLVAPTARLHWDDDAFVLIATDAHYFADGTAAHFREKTCELDWGAE